MLWLDNNVDVIVCLDNDTDVVSQHRLHNCEHNCSVSQNGINK
jgi:hypothetical protein